MILADKIIALRRQNGWSQEEFAEKMGVSRQAVSKWEGAQSTPDLERILEMARLFGVTTDYLLKDELESEEYAEEKEPSAKSVSMEFANQFFAWRREMAARISRGVFLCILSPIPLLVLAAMSQEERFGISETVAGVVGLLLLLAVVAVAVLTFVTCGFKNEPYKFLETEEIRPEYGVTGVAKERQKEYRPCYTRGNLAGVALCVLSPAPLLAGALTGNELLTVLLLCVTLLIAGIGVLLFVKVGTVWNGFAQLLGEGEYTAEEKARGGVAEKIGRVYWPVVTAVYLAWSILADAWGISWVVWIIAGVLFVGVVEAARVREQKK